MESSSYSKLATEEVRAASSTTLTLWNAGLFDQTSASLQIKKERIFVAEEEQHRCGNYYRSAGLAHKHK